MRFAKGRTCLLPNATKHKMRLFDKSDRNGFRLLGLMCDSIEILESVNWWKWHAKRKAPIEMCLRMDIIGTSGIWRVSASLFKVQTAKRI